MCSGIATRCQWRDLLFRKRFKQGEKREPDRKAERRHVFRDLRTTFILANHSDLGHCSLYFERIPCVIRPGILLAVSSDKAILRAKSETNSVLLVSRTCYLRRNIIFLEARWLFS